MSILSSGSVESDWSDEELEELEKMFGSIQHKSSMAETTTGRVFTKMLKTFRISHHKMRKNYVLQSIVELFGLQSSTYKYI